MSIRRNAIYRGMALGLLVGAGLTLGCNKSEKMEDSKAEMQQEKLKPEPQKPKRVKPPAPPSLTAAEKEKIPTEEDFEEEAESEITLKNLESEVTKLEQELAQ